MNPNNRASTAFFAMSHVYNLNPIPPPIFNKKQKRKKYIKFFFFTGFDSKKVFSFYIYIYIEREREREREREFIEETYYDFYTIKLVLMTSLYKK